MGRGWLAAAICIARASPALGSPGVIDRAGGEGRSSTPIASHGDELRATPPGGSTPAPPIRGAYAIGTHFEHCRAPGTDRDFVATRAGMVELACGQARVDVVIAPVVVATDAPALPRGREHLVHLTVASVAALGEALEVGAEGDIELGTPRRTEHGIDVPVRVAPGARTAALSVEGGGQTLGRVELALTDPSPEPTRLDWLALDAGGQLGALWLPGEGRAQPRLGPLTSGALFGGEVGLYPVRWVGLEAEVAVVATADGGAGATVIASRGQLAVRAFDRGWFGIRLIGGAGAVTLLHQGTAGEVHAGVAVTAEAAPDWWVRLQIADVVTTAADAGYAQCPELQLGLMTRIGRRDRW